MKNLKKLKRSQLVLISGGDTAYAVCLDGYCPPTFGSYYCSGDTCYRSTGGGGNPGGGGPGGGGTPCHEPIRFCQEGETGCGCVN
ncbi:hypothetical protein [Chryseobacterium artocarpi]|uniref:hypothetical protein n=1 Tax=Chryseobacterium artocarpi TaxID=1414727 RepID=UPI0009F64269|nr:hypothetical protein [Chryseobacterium artocarpi]